ncbi:MAG: RNA polymerase sigma factor [Phycisphaerae bacterium]|nr:RNA polymerase sigma factor [Phycisphaerae bacterium]
MDLDTGNNKLEFLTIDQLACGAQKGDTDCFEKLVGELSGRLFQFLRYRTGNAQDAEDVLQETFVRIYTQLDRYKPGQKFTPWAYTIAVRLAMNHYRDEQRRKAADGCVAADLSCDPACLIEQQEQRESLWRHVRSLPTSQHHALWFRYVEGMTVKEIAAVMDKTQIAVKVLLYRARRAMAGKLAYRDGRQPLPEGGIERTMSFVRLEGER